MQSLDLALALQVQVECPARDIVSVLLQTQTCRQYPCVPVEWGSWRTARNPASDMQPSQSVGTCFGVHLSERGLSMRQDGQADQYHSSPDMNKSLACVCVLVHARVRGVACARAYMRAPRRGCVAGDGWGDVRACNAAECLDFHCAYLYADLLDMGTSSACFLYDSALLCEGVSSARPCSQRFHEGSKANTPLIKCKGEALNRREQQPNFGSFSCGHAYIYPGGQTSTSQHYRRGLNNYQVQDHFMVCFRYPILHSYIFGIWKYNIGR